MIRAVFFKNCEGLLSGFYISGHSEMAEAGNDVLCAFVSSAAYLTANTVTEIIGADADAEAEDGEMRLTVNEKLTECQTILAGLILHLEETEKQYPENLNVTITEV